MMETEETGEEYDLDTLAALLDADDDEEGWSIEQPSINSDKDISDNQPHISDESENKESTSPESSENVNLEDLGLVMSDDENEGTEPQPSTSSKKSSFSDAFAGSKFSKNGGSKSGSQTHSETEVDPLESELRLMEERMKTLRQQLAKKKRLDSIEGGTSKTNFTKLTNVSTESKHSVRTLSEAEELKLYKKYGNKSKIHKGDTDSEDEEDDRNPFEQKYNSYGREIKKRIAHETSQNTHASQSKNDEVICRMKSTSAQPPGWKGIDGSLVSLKHNGAHKGIDKQNLESDKNTVVDFYSGIRIVNPLESQEAMKERMVGRKMVRMSAINLHVRCGEIEGDWVTIGVLISKSDPKTSQKGSQYSIWKLSDLQDCTKTVALFLFTGAHKNLWKHSIGTVVGLLNPTIMKDRQGDKNTEILTLSIYDANKAMLMGSSKDLGWCKGRTKANGFCKSFVNKASCEFCIYHIQREYQKSSSKRADIQSSFTRVDPKKRLQERILGKDQVFYGGQLFTASSPANTAKAHKALKAKDLSTLNSLKLKLKTQELKEEDKKASFILKHMSDSDIKAVGRVAQKNEYFSEKLLAPTPGARNLLSHMSKEDNKKKVENGEIRSISAKELLTMTHKKILTQKNSKLESKSNASSSKPRLSFSPTACPMLGRGIQPGVEIDLEISPPPPRLDHGKSRALAVLKAKGGIQAANPNSVRNITKASDPEFQDKVRKRLSTATGSEDEMQQSKKSKLTEVMGSPPSKLGSLAINSDKFKAMMEQKSRHTNLVNDVENEAMEKYYQGLEKKEMLEEKLASIMEIPTTAYVCIKCRYMAQSASDFCREENHPLKAVKTKKRFFECRNCKRRTTSLDKLPRNPCSNCDQSSWQRVSMGKAKSGPKLDSEVLSLRGDELTHYSGNSNKVYLHI